jgi:hypothetical protein
MNSSVLVGGPVFIDANRASLVGIHVRAQNEALFRNEHRFSRASIIETR